MTNLNNSLLIQTFNIYLIIDFIVILIYFQSHQQIYKKTVYVSTSKWQVRINTNGALQLLAAYVGYFILLYIIQCMRLMAPKIQILIKFIVMLLVNII